MHWNGKYLRQGVEYIHRLVASKKLGRRLLDGEVVHHIDENTKNNSPENLMVLKSDAQHQLLHSLPKDELIITACADGAYIVCKKPLLCEVCGKEFEKKHGDKKTRRFCSPECGYKAAQKVERPSREELMSLIWQMPTLKVAQKFSVSDKAVEKWCKQYDIPKPPRGYWRKIGTAKNKGD